MTGAGPADEPSAPPPSRVTSGDRWFVRGYLLVVAAFLFVGAVMLFAAAPAWRAQRSDPGLRRVVTVSPEQARHQLLGRTHQILAAASGGSRSLLAVAEDPLSEDLAARFDDFAAAAKTFVGRATKQKQSRSSHTEDGTQTEVVRIEKTLGGKECALVAVWALDPDDIWRLRSIEITGEPFGEGFRAPE